jgi:acetate kinase
MSINSTYVLAINGGSSSIKFSLFDARSELTAIFRGSVNGIGTAIGNLMVKGLAAEDNFSRSQAAGDHGMAVEGLMDWLEERMKDGRLAGVGHRVVHGGPKYAQPQRITESLMKDLVDLSPFDPQHLPEEIELTQAFHRRFSYVPQVACFDTAFHHDLPRVARLLPIPRRYETLGVRRYGFHGISYAYLMRELARVGGPDAARGRVILAHLGSGASLAAVRNGKPVDTSMSFTPTAGVPMGTRCGDLDPGLMWYLFRTQRMTARDFNEMVNFQSGLLGMSERSSDIRDLLRIRATDVRAAEAVDVFCYQVKKWIGSFAAALGGVETLVFSGGIGEHSPEIRAQICAGLEFLGIRLASSSNANGGAVISTSGSAVCVRVMATDEERMIAEMVCQVLGCGASGGLNAPAP